MIFIVASQYCFLIIHSFIHIIRETHTQKNSKWKDYIIEIVI